MRFQALEQALVAGGCCRRLVEHNEVNSTHVLPMLSK
jgi:hypothetical protein